MPTDDAELQTKTWCLSDQSSPEVALGDGLFMHRDTRVVVRDWEMDVDIAIGVVGGRLGAEEVRVRRREGGLSVTSEAIRKLPVAALVGRAVEHIFYVSKAHQGAGRQISLAWPSAEELRDVASRGLSDESLKLVARIYRIAYLVGEGPTRKVESLLGLPRSTAGRWVAAARERGYLSEAPGQGKAGI